MRPAAILLDAGNTLVEPDFGVIAGLFRSAGFEVDPDRARRALGRTLPDLDAWLRGGRSTEGSDALGFFLGRFCDRLGAEDPAVRERVGAGLAGGRFAELWYSPLPGAHETVRELLARGHALAVVSNSDGRVAEKLERGGFRGLFETIVDSGLEGVEKPDPRIFAIALERLGARQEEAVHVGDLPSVDVAGARAAGVAPVLVDAWDGFADLDVPRIPSLTGLLPLLDAGFPPAASNPE